LPQPKKGPRLGSGPKHQRLMLSGLALSLFEHERVKTTEAKAKALKPYAERLITKAKAGGVHERRQVLALIEDRSVVHKLFADIAPRFTARNGGYTRILKLGPRNGDGAPMALIELVEGAMATTVSEETGTRRRLRRSSASTCTRTRPGRRRTAPDTDETTAAAEADETGSTEESISESSDESSGDEPVEQPGDADAATSQDSPGETDSSEEAPG
jgi:large subunit ribosomal protein L17